MVRAWYYSESAEPKCESHMPNPPSFLSLEEVCSKTGIEYVKFPAQCIDTNPEFNEMKKDRGYHYEDEIMISPTALPDYSIKEKIFYTEHIHADEEIRFFKAGGGYFDIRDAKEDAWIRIECNEGDLLILPAGIYHRFTLDHRNLAHQKRLFLNEPCWSMIKRPTGDEHPARKEYLNRMIVSK